MDSDLKRSSSEEKGSIDANVYATEAATGAPHTHVKRVMTQRQVQMYSIGGVIGTSVFVSIGGPLTKAGPLNLLLAYTVWCAVIFCVNECQAEMVVFLPIESSFSRFATRWIDDAVGCMTAWNYYLCMTSLLCFEITALQTVLSFWSSDIPLWAIPLGMLSSYALLHLYSSRWFAESEFWLVLGKITLMCMLFIFTFVTMVGGNPLHDAFGFRSWREPGPVKEYLGTGSSGYFQAFWVCLLSASFAVSGPDMMSMIAAETINPRKVMKTAFQTVYIRLMVFFVLSALAVGILCPSNDPNLLAAIAAGTPGAGRSPYVAAMNRLQIPVLPHVVNAGIATSIYSAGSAFFFGGSRILHALAVDGYAPAFIRPTNARGVPWIACLITLGVGCLSFLQVSAGTNRVLGWFINVATSTQLVTWMIMSATYIRWRKAMAVQGYSRDALPYRSWCQPYAAWIGLVCSTVVTLSNGYYVFLTGGWSTADFLFAYGSPLLCIFVFIARKSTHRVPFVKPENADLVSGLAEIAAHEDSLDLSEQEKVGWTRWQRIRSWIL